MLSVRGRGKPCNRVHQPLEGSLSVFSESLIEGNYAGKESFLSSSVLFSSYRKKCGVGTALKKDSGLGESLDLTPPVPNPALVPSASHSPANTKSYKTTHGPPAIMGWSKTGFDCVCGGLGALCSCVLKLKWGTASPALAAGALLASRLHPSLAD